MVVSPLVAAVVGADGALVVAAQAGEFAGEVLELAETFFGVLDLAQGLDLHGEFGGQDHGDVFGNGHGSVAGVGFQVGGLFGGPAGLLAQELVAQPIEVAAFAPFGEVLRTDGQAGELFGDDFLDFGQLVEPCDERGSEFAVFEALVELFADGFGEAGDFAGASFHRIFCHRDTEGTEVGRWRSQSAPYRRLHFSFSCGAVLARGGFAEKLTVMFYVDSVVGEAVGSGKNSKKRAKTRLF